MRRNYIIPKGLMFLGIALISSGFSFLSFKTAILRADNKNYVYAGILDVSHANTYGPLINPVNVNEKINSDPYYFIITNTGQVNAYYEITLTDYEDEIKVCGCQDKLLPKEYINYQLYRGNELVVSGSLVDILNGFLYKGIIYMGSSNKETFTLILNYNSKITNKYNGYHYHGKVNVIMNGIYK